MFPILIAGAAAAAEPVGSASIEASWVQRGDDDDRRTLRVAIRPLVPLKSWELVVTTPLSHDVRARVVPPGIDFRSVPTSARRTLRGEMAELDAGAALVLEFEVLLPPHGGGTIGFVAETEDGRVLGGTGITARAPGPPPRRRLGAVEYPAGVVSAAGTD